MTKVPIRDELDGQLAAAVRHFAAEHHAFSTFHASLSYLVWRGLAAEGINVEPPPPEQEIHR